MTAQPTSQSWQPHPLVAPLVNGSRVDTWCRHHGRLVPHVFRPGGAVKLVCLICHPEEKERQG